MQAILLYFSDFVTKYYWMFLYNLVIIAKIQNHEKHANIKAFSWFVKDLIVALQNKNKQIKNSHALIYSSKLHHNLIFIK